MVNGNKISDPSLMAENFNKFFATAAVEVVSKINPSNLSPTDNIPLNNSIFSLNNTPVTISEILEATKLLQDKKLRTITASPQTFLKKLFLTLPNLYTTFFFSHLKKALSLRNLKLQK